MSTALQIRPAETMADWQTIRDQAAVLVTTGFLPQSIKSPEQAMAIILTGRELGIGTMAALNTINVIQGKPTVSPQLMLALINRSNQLEDYKLEKTADHATCTMKRKGRTPHTVRFGREEASAMGLLTKDNYKKQPATMFGWRAVAMCARDVFPDVILGLYTPDEMGAVVDTETGEVIEVTPEPQRGNSDRLTPIADPEPVEVAEEMITDQQLSHLLNILGALEGHGVTPEKWREGLKKIANVDEPGELTSADGAKVIQAFSRRLDQFTADKERAA